MSAHQAFDLIAEEQIPEVNSLVRRYRHRKTGADVLSLINDDENKVFGISFATPPEDSTGIAHILEHSVLCGSERFPVKKPFVEMIKGSLHTFLNAMTFPDKTVYPVASQNVADFYNLVDVYLDAVLFPLLSRETFLQEGWHYELETPGDPLIYKGVVFNEMKGGYSSPDQVFRIQAQASLFPDTIYGYSSGGDPKVMPDLTYEQFRDFHKRYYHPSNAQIIFYGDDDPDKRLELLDNYLSRFEKSAPADPVPLQPRFGAPKHVTATYPADETNARSAFVSVNWMFERTENVEENLTRTVMFSALVGNQATPLYKALTESGLGEAVIAQANGSFRQPWAYAGMRGVDAKDAGTVEELILDTINKIAAEGFDEQTVEATVNTLEFQLRERNTGGYPRGLICYFSALSDWLYGGDPLNALRFEEALESLKARLASGEKLLENLLGELLISNTHRTTLVLKADQHQAEREAQAERARLDETRRAMSDEDIAETIATTNTLKALQNAPDEPENLAKIPTLTVEDLPREGATIPTDEMAVAGVRTLYHDLPTNGIVYLDLGFDLKTLPLEFVPYLPIFTTALSQTGTSKEDYVSLTQRIGRATGGISAQRLTSAIAGSEESATYLVIRGKATADKAGELLSILHDTLTDARLDNRERIRQLVAQAKARSEAALVPSGHMMVFSRLRSSLDEADWINEQCAGLTQLFFLRELSQRIEDDWDTVLGELAEIRQHLINTSAAVVNVTADSAIWQNFENDLSAFLKDLPSGPFVRAGWGRLPAPVNEGFTIPVQVNYVAKGASLKHLGHNPSAALSVVTKFLGTSYLWDKIRVEGGAYGGFASYNPLSQTYAFGSYRDPNLTATLNVYDGASEHLRKTVSDSDLTRSIIGTISDLDPYMLPDAKGYTALVRTLAGVTDEYRQQRREQVLSTTKADFAEAADLLEEVARNGHVVVMGSEKAVEAANRERNGFLDTTKVL